VVDSYSSICNTRAVYVLLDYLLLFRRLILQYAHKSLILLIPYYLNLFTGIIFLYIIYTCGIILELFLVVDFA